VAFVNVFGIESWSTQRFGICVKSRFFGGKTAFGKPNPIVLDESVIVFGKLVIDALDCRMIIENRDGSGLGKASLGRFYQHEIMEFMERKLICKHTIDCSKSN
jgi:hypothetical protein